MRVRARLLRERGPTREFSHPGITPGAEYLVVGLDAESFRVPNDRGEPLLYPREMFVVVDAQVPPDWVRTDAEDGAYYVDPPECAQPGFYEDYFDGLPTAIETFQKVQRRLP